MTEEKYNGWTNYETWLLKLNLDNDYGIYTMCQEWFKDNFKVSETERPDNYEISVLFKEFLEEIFYIEDHSIYKICDTWTHRDWQEIDWIEITDAYIEELTQADWLDDHN